MVSEFDTHTEGSKDVTISYEGQTSTIEVKVLDYESKKDASGHIPITFKAEGYDYGTAAEIGLIGLTPDDLTLEIILPNGSKYYGNKKQFYQVYKNGTYTFTARSIDGVTTVTKTVTVDWLSDTIEGMDTNGGPIVEVTAYDPYGCIEWTATDESGSGLCLVYPPAGSTLKVNIPASMMYRSGWADINGSGTFVMTVTDLNNKVTFKEIELDTLNPHCLLSEIEYYDREQT